MDFQYCGSVMSFISIQTGAFSVILQPLHQIYMVKCMYGVKQ